ncbi:hypothetical protein I7I51_02983 [Histoplasma capsulatum]|uniref:Uncharacterized protein n=1 Tax=Ajellomyces capsulatus TaxID=5037 RepID=A0A8A1MQ42_AJECA|nr:hypothetical protein I7I51_02983 [Histoplasma capsulatum]
MTTRIRKAKPTGSAVSKNRNIPSQPANEMLEATPCYGVGKQSFGYCHDFDAIHAHLPPCQLEIPCQGKPGFSFVISRGDKLLSWLWGMLGALAVASGGCGWCGGIIVGRGFAQADAGIGGLGGRAWAEIPSSRRKKGLLYRR